MNPYTDKKLNNDEFIRTFDKNVLTDELVWHRDNMDRLVEVLEGEGWMMQFENQLPFQLKVGDVIDIPACTYHRIKRGRTDLKIRIREYD